MYYYQQIDDIGKEVAVVSSTTKIDSNRFRPITKEYYDEVIAFLRELNQDVPAEA